MTPEHTLQASLLVSIIALSLFVALYIAVITADFWDTAREKLVNKYKQRDNNSDYGRRTQPPEEKGQ